MTELECNEYYYIKGTIPPINLITWVSCYQLLMNETCEPLKRKNYE